MERARGAGPDLGDADLDSDAAGTGERMVAGRDSDVREGGDIGVDKVVADPGGMTRGDDPEGIGVSRQGGKAGR